MMVPDRNIVKKIQNYDPKLFVKWDNRRERFELWRNREENKGGGEVLVTPILKSIYDDDDPLEFCPLDERILFWIYLADSWRFRSSRDYAMEQDRRFKEFEAKLFKKSTSDYNHLAKEIWHGMNNKFVDKKASVNRSSKGRYPEFGKKTATKFLRPDRVTGKRTMQRTRPNAKTFNYQGDK